MHAFSFLRNARVALPLLLVASCGGKVIFESSNAAGSGGAGASISSVAVVGSSGTTAHTGTNVATVAVSTTGVATVATSTGSGPPPPPGSCAMYGFTGINGPCMNPGVTCDVPFACCGEKAQCVGGTWHAIGPLCNMPCIACGGGNLGCDIKAVCVVDQLQVSTPTFHCAADPCPPGALACGCAKKLCQQDGLSCAMAAGNTVDCDCPNCGG